MQKPWYKSKMVWLGVVEIISAGITKYAEVGPDWAAITLAVFGTITVVLRAKGLTK